MKNCCISELLRICCISDCCKSEDARENLKDSKELTRIKYSERERRRREMRCVLVGLPESGKTTFIKQMKWLHHGYNIDETRKFRMYVYSNIFYEMQKLIHAMETLHIEYSDPEVCEPLSKLIMEDTKTLTGKLISAIQTLWADGGVQQTWKRRKEFHIQETANYFFDNIERIWIPGYDPTIEDILHVYVPTTWKNPTTGGVTEHWFKPSGTHKTFKMVDTSGLQSKMENWLQYFDDEDDLFVLLFVPLNDFNQTVQEDCDFEMEEIESLFQSKHTYSWYQQNALHNNLDESRELFEAITTSARMDQHAVIVIFTKLDLIEEDEVVSSDFSEYFPELTNVSSDSVRQVAASMFVHTDWLERYFTCLTKSRGGPMEWHGPMDYGYYPIFDNIFTTILECHPRSEIIREFVDLKGRINRRMFSAGLGPAAFDL